MWGFFLRLLICIIAWVVYAHRRKRIDKHTRRGMWIVTCITTVIFLFIWTYPMENWVVSFSSPESLFKYMHDGEIQCVLEGNDSALVVSQKEAKQGNNCTVAVKAESGWKIPTSMSLSVVDQMRSNDALVLVRQYKKKQDYYLIVFGRSEAKLDVSDNRNSNFICVKDKIANRYSYFAYIKAYGENYQLKINGVNL